MDRKESIARLRTLINDEKNHRWSDDKLVQFIELAEEKIPFIAAAIFGVTFGNYEGARLMMAMAGMFSSEEEKPTLVSSTKGPL